MFYSKHRVADIRVNCLVARKGSNLVKCIQIGKDLIITVSGPEATALAEQLKMKIRKAEACKGL